MSTPIEVGMVMRKHLQEEGAQASDGNSETFVDVGVVIFIDKASDQIVLLPLPGRRFNASRKWSDESAPQALRTVHHIKQPKVESLAEISSDEEQYTFHRRADPPIFNLTDEELLTGRHSLIGSKARRDLSKSLAIRDRQWQWIEDLVKRPMAELLDPVRLRTLAQEVQLAFKLKRYQPVVRALRAYWLNGFMKAGLLPRFDLCNLPGKPKYAKVKTGRPSKKSRLGEEGYVLSEVDRDKLRRGWRRHKKQGVSVKKAYFLTMDEYWGISRTNLGPSQYEVKLLPPHERPTLRQFRTHGPGRDPANAAWRVNIGEIKHSKDHRPLHGSATDGIVAAGQLAEIDSTSDDQNLVSTASRLQPLSSPSNTKVVEVSTGYILGIHGGFEKPSTMTSLIALANALSPKENFCARYGVDLKPGEWITIPIKRVRADNGELKSEAGISTMEQSAIAAEFVKSYAADRKPLTESAHKSVAKNSSHQLAGSTQGKCRDRGDTDPSKNRCLNFIEYMARLITAVIFHNNHDRVPHLLTMEMRNQGVRPFRADILKWKCDNGYVVQEPSMDPSTLRSQCLPRLEGRLQRDGVRVLDPRCTEKKPRLIPTLVYSSKDLVEACGSSMRPGTSKPCDIYLDPSFPGEAWVRHDKLIRVRQKGSDPEKAAVPLLDWLEITDRDELARFLERDVDDDAATSIAVGNDQTSKAAAKAKQVEERQKGEVQKRPGGLARERKREATSVEAKLQQAARLGLSRDVVTIDKPRTAEPASSIVEDAPSQSHQFARSRIAARYAHLR